VARDLKVLAWITEGGWEAVVDAVAHLDPAEVTLLHVTSIDVPGVRGHRYEQVMGRMSALAGEAAQALLDDAAERLGRENVWTVAESGQAETIVMDALDGIDVLVVARDGRHRGPHSIGHEQRWVIDHAPCAVVLAWAPGAPDGGHVPKPKPKPKPKPPPG
jgi:hypothetical protein